MSTSSGVRYLFSISTEAAADGLIRRGAVVSGSTLSAAMVEALVALCGKPLTAYVRNVPGQHRERTEVLESRVRQVEARLGTLVAQQNALTSAVIETNPLTGQFVLGAAQRSALSDQFETAAAEVTDLTRQLEDLRGELATLGRALDTARTGVNVADLLTLVAELRDPLSTRARDLIAQSVRDLAFTTEDLEEAGIPGLRVRFSGRLVFHDPKFGAYEVPFSGSEEHGVAWLQREDRARELIAELRQGISLRRVHAGGSQAYMPVAARILGVESTKLPEAGVADGPLLRLRMAIRFPHPVKGEDISGVPTLAELMVDPLITEFGDVEALVNRIRHLNETFTSSRWLTVAGRREAQVLVAAMNDGTVGQQAFSNREFKLTKMTIGRTENAAEWTFGPGPWHLKPCRFCGSFTRTAMRIREVSGYLCLSCRRDTIGVRWPQRFDRFIGHPQLWVTARPSLQVPSTNTTFTDFDPQVPASARARTERRTRSLDNMEAKHVAALIADYQHGGLTIRAILAKHNVGSMDLYELLERHDIPRRHGEKKQRAPRRVARQHRAQRRPERLGPDQRTVRAWALEAGIKVSAQGRLSPKVVDLYKRAHPVTEAADESDE